MVFQFVPFVPSVDNKCAEFESTKIAKAKMRFGVKVRKKISQISLGFNSYRLFPFRDKLSVQNFPNIFGVKKKDFRGAAMIEFSG